MSILFFFSGCFSRLFLVSLVSHSCSCIAVIYPSVCAGRCRFSHLLVFFMLMVSSSDSVFCRYPCVTFLFHFSSRSFLVPSLTLLLSWYASLPSFQVFLSFLSHVPPLTLVNYAPLQPVQDVPSIPPF